MRYRLGQVERLLGHPASEHRLALELSFHLAARLAPWVLAPAAPAG